MIRVSQQISIRHKLMVVIMAVSVGVLLLASLAFIINETLTFRRQIQQELKALAGIIGNNTTAAITFGDRASAAKALQSLSAKPFILSAYIFTPDGELFARYLARGVNKNRLKFERQEEGRPENSRTVLAEIVKESQQWWSAWDGDLDVVDTILLDNQPIGTVTIQSDLWELFYRLKGFAIMVGFILIGAMIFTAILSNKLQRPISRPILDLAHTMRTVSEEKNYAIRAVEHGRDEIGQLIKGFNDMLSQIQKRDDHLEHFALDLKEHNIELKSFIFSAAHDLRQPLVNIRGFSQEIVRSLQDIQAILSQNAERLSEEDRNRITAIFHDDIQLASGFIGSSVQRMANLINALLKLSQAGHRELRPEPLSMKNLVQSSMRDVDHQLRENNITVICGDLPDVTADRTAIEQIVGNLLDNAVKYLVSGRPGQIEISGERTEDGVIYHVRDNGRGITHDDMPILFNMFRRLGQQDVPGEGVGLTYTRALVRLHGGRIWCESEANAGSTFSFFIPQDQRPSQSPREEGVMNSAVQPPGGG